MSERTATEVPGPAKQPGHVPVDLDNCDREPIHVPGSVQPRGVLLALHPTELVVQQASRNLGELAAVAADAVGLPLAAVLGDAAANAVRHHVSTFGTLRDRNPLELSLPSGDGREVRVDAILHHAPGGALVMEMENAVGPRPFSFPNTYQAVRGAVADLNRAAVLTELYDIAAREVRALTGFDRVMIYRYDRDFNGEVVAEARRADLNSFLGLHYPASDIPAQARALYEKNWIRLIDDVGYTPVPVVPAEDPLTGAPLDLTHATLRSVSPIHVEYLQNMGVRASMSLSLLRDGRLWGLVACHHYSGPHAPPYGVRAAAEFLASSLSLRLVDRDQEEERQEGARARSRLAAVTARTLDESVSVARSLCGSPGLLDLVPAGGAVALLGEEVSTAGAVPPPEVVRSVAQWAASTGKGVVATESLATDAPHVGAPTDTACGALVLSLGEAQAVVWFRTEAVHTVDWGGDPHNKALARAEGDTVRLSPRRSFERWREVVRGRCAPWTPTELAVASDLRLTLLQVLHERDRRLARVAATLQHSLLPEALPQPAGWSVSARYSPSAGGEVGGDWYDGLVLPDGRLAAVVGDVAGHGLAAAGVMGQLRNALRAYLVEDGSPSAALTRLDDLVRWLLPEVTASVVVAVVDPGSGRTRLASAGHPPPFLVSAGQPATLAESDHGPLIGAPGVDRSAEREVIIEPGGALVLYSDGLVERRSEDLDAGLLRLRRALAAAGTAADASGDVFTQSRDPQSEDDATLLVVRRDLPSDAG